MRLIYSPGMVSVIASNYGANFLILILILSIIPMLPGCAVLIASAFVRSPDARRILIITGILLTIGGGMFSLWRWFGHDLFDY